MAYHSAMGATGAIVGLWLLFAATHMGLSSLRVRPRLVAALGPGPFAGLYSLLALAIFIPLVWVYLNDRHAGPLLWALPIGPLLRWLFSEFDARVGHHRRYDRATLLALTPPGTRLRWVRYLDFAGLGASLANRFLMRSPMPSRSQVMVWDRLLVPLSRPLDRLLRYRAGKSILAVWERCD